MNAPSPQSPAAQQVLPGDASPAATALRWLCDPRPDVVPSALDFAPLGAVLEAAIDAKLVCLLADRLLNGRPDAGLSRPMRSVLGQIVRANALHNRLHRGEAVRIVRALAVRAVPVAVLNGLAYDTALYPPGGLRQFTDIDLLVSTSDRDTALDVLAELGFTEPGRGAHTRRRSTGDALTPTVSVDIATNLGHTADPADVGAALARTEAAGGPDAGEQLPALTRVDALVHALARLAARPRWSGLADVARLAPAQDPCSGAGAALPERARAGWAVLRTHLPDLFTSTSTGGGPGRGEVTR